MEGKDIIKEIIIYVIKMVKYELYKNIVWTSLALKSVTLDDNNIYNRGRSYFD